MSVIIEKKMDKWHDSGAKLQDALEQYNWEYRKKICVKCPLEVQQKLHCIKGDRVVEGIQETYCEKLVRARTKKMEKKIDEFLESHPLRDGI
ncbi:MAG: hypothetical protein K5777_04545 [Nitrosopumilus sp.]|nr:hypothetical protein [Nitrosopumilus sp.]